MQSDTVSTHRENWEGLRRALVWRAAVVLAALAWLAWLRESAAKPVDNGLTWLTVAAAAFMVGLAVTRRLPARWAAVSLACVALIAVGLVYRVLGYTQAAPFLAIPVAIAALAVSPWLAPVFGLADWLLLGSDPAGAWAGRSFVLVVVGIVMLWGHYLHRELANAWSYAERYAGLTEEVRRRQEQVRQLNKSLQVSNALLKRSLGELAAAQRETEAARQLKEQFATTVSHELRTPLNVILGFVEVMQRYPEVYGEVTWTPELRRDISEIQVSARYLSDLVDDILDLARIQALKMPVHRKHANLLGLVREAADLASRLLLEREGVALRLELPPSLPEVYVDGTRVRQVLLNLLANAARFTQHGHITVSAGLGQDEVVLSVSDTGTGIPADQLEVIFDEFSQAQNSGADSLRRSGTGLGLAIAKRFVQMHGGRIWAESRLGEGSTFRFSLPLGEKQVVRLAPPPVHNARRALGSPAVIVVDSGRGAGAFLGRHLDGYEVVQAASMAEARGLVRELHPRALITNVPSESLLASHGTAPPIVPEPVHLLQCCLPSGDWAAEQDLFDDWLVKPIDSARLLSTLARFAPASRLLLVDDDASFVHLIRRILQAQPEQFEVASAYDGRLAVETAREFAPDVVLLDIALPGLNGREVARALRQSHASSGGHELHIIAVTAVQPGLEEPQAAPGTFAVTAYHGLSEEDTLHLIEACLHHLKPAYLPDEESEDRSQEPESRR